MGSVLSNLLLVFGMSCFAGGLGRKEQDFNLTAAQTASGLLFLSVAAFVIPTAYHISLSTSDSVQLDMRTTQLSRGASVMLLVAYGCFLFFQLKSHVETYQIPSAKNKRRHFRKMTSLTGHAHHSADPEACAESEGPHEQQVPETPKLSLLVAISTLILSTALVALNAEYLVASINAITCGSAAVSKSFVGLILLPIVGNATEHITAVNAAVKDKMDLAIGIALGSSMQIALLVLPFTVLLGWMLNGELTLYFGLFQLVAFVAAVMLVNYLIQDGKSNWLEGMVLMILYVIIGIAAWFIPTQNGGLECPA